ncbi:hypothetical protein OnM2_044043c [Erysiphe neolycopersici]|uniref:Ribosomal protein L34 n=1 Tax=Erysiphe neolycopersici TaxID=212602 RepID=A0A420HUV2_9PEZI|nr:hypothetical protein OnM2_044043c [Erysiphe neolycopersici]
MSYLQCCREMAYTLRIQQSAIMSTSRKITYLKNMRRTFTIYTSGIYRPVIQSPSSSSILSNRKPIPIHGGCSGHIELAHYRENTPDICTRITSHPGFSSIQIRCGPRNTFNPSHFVRKRRHGFLSRVRTRKGRMTLLRRKTKKRNTLSH